MFNEIEDYLSIKNNLLDSEIKDKIEKLRLIAISEQNEVQANYLWCLKQIYSVQENFLSAFHALQKKEYEKAWLSFDHADIELGSLEDNFNTEIDNDKYHMVFIGRIIKNYQKLFPYRFFISRESIIKEEKCTICGKIVSLRHQCNHKIGKIYMGELCLREVIDFELKAFCIVMDPFDKYSYLKIQDHDYCYNALDSLMSYIDVPYEDFYIETTRIKNPDYLNIGRNEKCPCGSDKKYKKCHCDTEKELINHYIINFPNKGGMKSEAIKYSKTMK